MKKITFSILIVFKKMFNCEDKMQHCSGELYYLLDAKGNIVKDNDSQLIEDLEYGAFFAK